MIRAFCMDGALYTVSGRRKTNGMERARGINHFSIGDSCDLIQFMEKPRRISTLD